MNAFVVVHHNGGAHAYPINSIERVTMTADGRVNLYFKGQVRGQEVTDKFDDIVQQLNSK